MDHQKKILIYGYGNPGRQDDALGVLLSEEIEKWCQGKKNDCIETDSNYQLNIEDAHLIKDKKIVIFADASMEESCINFSFTEVIPSEKTEFTMHAVSPAFVMNLCNKLYHISPAVYLLHIKGYKWEFQEGITEKAKKNLDIALDFIKKFITPLCFENNDLTDQSAD